MEALLFATSAAAAAWVLAHRKADRAKPFVCGAGSDCPCWHAEGRRPPLQPAKTGPIRVVMEPGKPLWLCTCGASRNYPYCDGSHRAVNAADGTKYAPVKAEGEGEKWLCGCGHSKSGVFCDGSHKTVHKA